MVQAGTLADSGSVSDSGNPAADAAAAAAAIGDGAGAAADAEAGPGVSGRRASAADPPSAAAARHRLLNRFIHSSPAAGRDHASPAGSFLNRNLPRKYGLMRPADPVGRFPGKRAVFKLPVTALSWHSGASREKLLSPYGEIAGGRPGRGRAPSDRPPPPPLHPAP